MFRHVPVLVAMAGAGLGLVRAQQTPTFLAGTRAVALYATVVDKTGEFVPGLTAADFEVDDNGKRQTLTNFANDLQPITAVLMLDRSGTNQRTWELESGAAGAFIGAMLPDDRARIGTFANDVRIAPPAFTADHDALTGVLSSSAIEAAPTPLWDATAAAMAALERVQGRRVVFVFTDGADSPGTTVETATLADVLGRSESDGIMVYAVGIAVKCGAGDRASFDPNQPDATIGGRGGGRSRGRGGERGGRGGGGSAAPCLTPTPDPGLKKLGAPGGGTYLEIKGTEDLHAMFARIVDELHHQYLLGFTTRTLDGQAHRLTVKVHRSNVTVRARTSYLATPEK